MLAQVSNGKLGLGGIFDGLKVDLNKYKEVIDSFKGIDLSLPEYKDFNTGKANWDAIAKAIKGCDETALSYFKTLDDGKGTINNQSASVEGLSAHLKATGQSFNFAAIKATLFNTALNAGIFFAITTAIQLTVKAIDQLVHAEEIALEKADAAQTTINDLNSEYESHKKTVEELAKSYEKLSKGVDTASNTNLSLSDEDYESYLDITNQLAETFPSLKTTIDENGNAILSLGQNGRTASEDLAELLKAEEDLNNYKISQNIDDLFGGIKVKVKEARESMEEFNSSSAKFEDTLNTIKQLSANGIDTSDNYVTLSGNTSDAAGIEYYNAMSTALQNFNKTLDDTRRVELDGIFNPMNAIVEDGNGAFEIYLNTALLSEEEKEQLQNEIKAQASEVIPMIQDEINNALSEKSSSQQEAELAWRDFIPSLVSTMKSQGSFKDLANGAFGEDIQNFAIDLVSNLDYSIAEQMEQSGGSYEWVRNSIILPLTQLDDSARKSIVDAYNRLLELNPNDLSEQNQEAIDELIRQIAVLLGNEGTADDIAYIRLNLGFKVNEDLQAKYNEAIKNSTNKLGISKDQLEALFTELEIDTSAEIDRWNKIVESTNNATEAKKQYLETKVENTAEPITFDPSAFSETISALSDLQSKYNDFYNDVKDGADFTFDISDIESLREAFGDTCAEFENFEKLATSSSTSAEELQESFDRLATQYVISSLDGLNESTREQIISQLELQGIIGASELITDELASAYGILADNGYSLADATNTAYWSLLDEANASELTKGSIYALAAAEIAYNNTGLDVQGKISQLGALASAYGDTATAAIAAAAADRVANGHGDYESVYADMMASINRASQTSTLKLGQSSANASKGKSGSKSKKETAEEFDWIEKKIENLEDDISRLDKVAGSSYSSISEKNEALAEGISKINEEINLQQQAYERYMAKAESVGLSDEYKNLVQDGSLDIEEITDEDLKEAISNYEQWYDKAKEAQDKINDLYDDARDKHVEAYELEADEIEKLRDNQAITEREYLDAMLELWKKYYAAN